MVRLLVAVICVALAPSVQAASDATLFRIFLKDGSALVSYGEFARVEDRVVFSMPVGGSSDDPRLHVVWIAADSVDWERTDRYAHSARYQHYADTRGESDFQQLNNEVARVLNDIALSSDRASALALAERARQALADWPQDHHGYRQEDVREIISLIDEAIAGLRAADGANSFALSLVAATSPVPLEPVLGMPSHREQLEQILQIANTATDPSERMALLQSARALLVEAGPAIDPLIGEATRGFIEGQIRQELAVDRRYAQLSRRLMNSAVRAASRAQVSRVERVLKQLEREDRKLGSLRPDIVASLRASLESSLSDARHLRLLRDQWVIRQSIYRDYQRLVGIQFLSLVRSQPHLEAIRKLDGPSPNDLQSLSFRLSGGAARLERLTVPADLRATHDLLVTAWRFAENAVQGRTDAIATGSVSKAWEASSAAAGSLMLLSRAQQDIKELLEPPRLQ